MIVRIGLLVALLGAGLSAYVAAAYFGALGAPDRPGEIAAVARPAALDTAVFVAQERARRAIAPDAEKQILFGDLHVHTTYSMDAFLTSLPIMQGEGAHPPADACDFARFCSGLDFYSINDHAEGLTPSMWKDIKESVRRCNAASDPDSPDLVAYLGWEWTQMGNTAAEHYGHKNVVLLDTEEERTPTRPIASAGNAYDAMRNPRGRRPVLALGLMEFPERQRYFDLLALQNAVSAVPRCESGVAVRELPEECSETAATPRELFDKLDDWGFESLVIPHGNAWGNTTPAEIDWEKQLANGNHDPERQTLVEVYSGHGNSEVLREWRHVERDAEGQLRCPAPSEEFVPECHRAGEIIEGRCLSEGSDAAECAARAVVARQHFVEAGHAGTRVVPGERAEDWLDAGQCTDCFQPAFLYRPGGSTQRALAVSGAGVEGAPEDPRWRFRFGLIASSDNHTARPASGYKEFRALGMTDALHAAGSRALREVAPVDREPRPHSVSIDPAKIPLVPGGDERLSSFYYTGGLVATHAESRDRESIWKALKRREVYGTSGPRILLWFDLLEDRAGGGDGLVAEPAAAPDAADPSSVQPQSGQRPIVHPPSGQRPIAHPMGSELELRGTPRFRVRAVGSRVQRPGCPDSSRAALGAERLALLCLSECHHPGDERRRIDRIEVVRIRPRVHASEEVAPLVEDPWKVHVCAPDEAGCSFEFEDPDFAESGRDHVYYVRALEEPSELVNADPLRCERDEAGACVSTRVCRSGGKGAEADECLGREQPRAWSSPIFVDAPRPPTS